MMTRPRIYLDHAATTWPKPDPVYAAVDAFSRQVGVAAGRGRHASSQAAGRVMEQARQRIAQLIHATDAQSIALTSGGTESLNLALHGMLRPGDHVVTTVTEHNSVLRPLHVLQQRNVQVTYVPCDARGYIDPGDIVGALQRSTRLVAINHGSNVTGALQPIGDLGAALRDQGIPLLVDAAQTAGIVDIDVETDAISLLAAPGHKGLLGPLGTGFLYVAPALHSQIIPLMQGGTGSFSELETQPDRWPDRVEAGSANTPAVAGLVAGLEHRLQHPLPPASHKDRRLADFLEQLGELPDWTLWGPLTATHRIGVFSLTHPHWDPHELAAILESEFGIESRAGLHCAPRLHRHLGRLGQGGTLRLSIGPTSSPNDLPAAIAALRAIGRAME